jgi:hypothetical protein
MQHWQNVPEFQHPDPLQGEVSGVEAVSLEDVPGKRQYWLYRVRIKCVVAFPLYAAFYYIVYIVD